MKVNKLIKDILGTATGLPVVQDEYVGDKTEYITFTYLDERPVEFGDDRPIIDTVYLQIQLITPKSYNYLNTKELIKATLEENDFIVTSIRSFLGSEIYGTEKIRQTIFECSYTEPRKE